MSKKRIFRRGVMLLNEYRKQQNEKALQGLLQQPHVSRQEAREQFKRIRERMKADDDNDRKRLIKILAEKLLPPA